MIWGRAVCFVNVRDMGSIRFTSRVLSIGGAPHRSDTVVDVDGAYVLPGLVNAHDHLELNHYGRLKFRERYENVNQWIDDMRPRVGADPGIQRGRAYSLTDRLFAGALKNLLSGVTTVAHHNPHYGELRRTMPIRVLRRYGWAHSFALENQPAGARGEVGGSVQQRWRRTSAEAPFIVHLAEGVDAAARAELPRFEALGCLAENTVLVHGVALDADGFRRVAAAGASLVWCPASNIFLFGRTAAVRLMLDAARETPSKVALGTDSRLTGARDLLDEARVAHGTRCASADELLAMVTIDAAEMLRLSHVGRIAVGLPADLIVVPAKADSAAASLLSASRASLACVVASGRVMIASPGFASAFEARGSVGRPVRIDGTPKLMESGLLRRVSGSPIVEPGLSVS